MKENMIVKNDQIKEYKLPGLSHRTVAGPLQGCHTLEVWVQTVDPGAATPVHRHDCEEAIVILEGHGILELEGRTKEFGPGDTLIVPRDAVHQVTCAGPEPLRLVAALGAAPVRVHNAENERIPLPWDAPDPAH
jgi:quercetin dioxygenase-like cupin family protein